MSKSKRRKIRSGRRRKARGSRRSPRQRWQEPTAEQQVLYDELQGAVDPSAQESITDLRQQLVTLTSQRDDALKQVNDRANIEIAFTRLGRGIAQVEEIVHRLRELQIDLGVAATRWVARQQRVERST